MINTRYIDHKLWYIIFSPQKCICCNKEDQELYTGARYRCHKTYPADRPKHNKLCKTCGTDSDHPDENKVTNDCIDYCRYHGESVGGESAE